MAIEDFSTYTEVDPNSKIAVGTRRVTAADVDRDEDVYLYKDFGADYFDGLALSFTLLVNATSTPAGGSAAAGGIALSNTIDDLSGHGTTDINVVIAEETSGFKIFLERGPGTAVDSYLGSADTVYYCTLTRAAGNDTATLRIYSDSARTILLDTLTVSGYGASKWRYCYAFVNWNNGQAGADFDGYSQDLELLTITELLELANTYLTDFTDTTVTGNAYIVNTGISSVTEHGHCWATSYDPDTTDSKTTNGAGVLGLFSSSITGLITGQQYYTRGYATNTEGTAYSPNIKFTAGRSNLTLLTGEIAVVQTRLHYVGNDGKERWLEGTLV